MSDDRKTEKTRIENLELNRETVADLTEQESEAAAGGLAPGPKCLTYGDSCRAVATGNCG